MNFMRRTKIRHPQYVLILALLLFGGSSDFAPLVAQSGSRLPAQYGAPVPPLVPAADPMIQGPVYGSPVTPAYAPSSPSVPSFWQTNPQLGQPVYGAPVGEVIGGEIIDGQLIQPIEGTEGIVEAITDPAAEEVAEELRPFNPVWYNPMSWLGPYWDGSVEFGLNGSSGNADAQSIRAGFNLSRETQRTHWDIDLNYNNNEADDVATANNALLFSNWDFKMRNPRWTWFTKFGLEWDEFRDFDIRLSANTGLGYLLIDTDKTQFRPRFGAGVSREFGGLDEDVKPEAVFGFDFSRQISSRQQFTATADYFPAWDDFSDYRVITDVGWELVLDEVNNLSLKVSVIDRYDSTPNGAEANDINYSVLLLWSL